MHTFVQLAVTLGDIDIVVRAPCGLGSFVE